MSGSDSPRDHPRQRALKGARIVFNNGNSSVDVVVRDISESGAKLKLAAASWVAPDTFDLAIQNPGGGISVRYHCEKRWQRGDLVGARFVETPPKRPPAIPAARSAPPTLTRA